METLYVKCPFCGEDDFDLIGLKYHLYIHCNNYGELPTLPGRSEE